MNDKDNVIPWLLAAIAAFYAVYRTAPTPHSPPPAPQPAARLAASEPAPGLPAVVKQSLTTDPTEPTAEPHEAEDRHEAAAVEWLTWPEAAALSKETGRPVLVLQRYADPADDAACFHCQRLKKTLADPETFAAFAELGVPCLGDAETWQRGENKITAPTIAYVIADAKEGDRPPTLAGFRVAPAPAFLADLKAWIDGLEK